MKYFSNISKTRRFYKWQECTLKKEENQNRINQKER